MYDAIDERPATRLSLFAAIVIYVACLFAWLFFFVGVHTHRNVVPEQVLLPVGYLVIGWVLNRIVLRGLARWHHVSSNLATVVRSKVFALLFWPMSYAWLIFLVLLNKVL